MNIVDLFIILFAISSLLRGYHIGLIRQAGSTIGFIGGLILGSFISAHLFNTVGDPLTRSLISIGFVLIISFGLMTLGEYLGVRLKIKLINRPVDVFDRGLGSVMGVATWLFAAWLLASMLSFTPQLGLTGTIRQSHIIASLNRMMPPASQLLSTLNRLIDPNGFPRVFTGLEPSPKPQPLPNLGQLKPAVEAARASIVKVEGAGCGGIVEGSGFVFANDLVATNAHVIAGVKRPMIFDQNGTHTTRVVWFDPNLDLAVLQVDNLAGKPLKLNTSNQPAGTPAAVVGYPSGGNFSAQTASVIERFTALGRNIYDQGNTERQVYSVQARVVPGNSGGPLLGTDGRVLGVVFATSTTYNDVGYVLTAQQVSSELAQAQRSNTTYSTGSCSQ